MTTHTMPMELFQHQLANGLRLVHYRNPGSRFATVDLLYDVGSRDESPELTGLAHLFEHLMFGGTIQVPHLDQELSRAGGISNAWTSQDFTNYYETLPVQNIETALWLESDRMKGLAFTPESLEVQRKVVIEEFKQRCLNQPYGDLMHLLWGNAFTTHPYRWPTIGRDISHIEKVTMEQVKQFFYSHYAPDNAVLAIVADIEAEEAMRLVDKWFGDIPRRDIAPRRLPAEPKQLEARLVELERNVPHSLILRAYKMCGRSAPEFYAYDMLTDILANGNSSRFYVDVVSKGRGFIQLDASVVGCEDPGLLVVSGLLKPGTDYDEAEAIIDEQVRKVLDEGVTASEIEKCANKYQMRESLAMIEPREAAVRVAKAVLLGTTDILGREHEMMRRLSTDEVEEAARSGFDPSRCTTIAYHSASLNPLQQ